MQKFTRYVRLNYVLAASVSGPTPISSRFVSGTDKILEFATVDEATVYLVAANLLWETGTQPHFV